MEFIATILFLFAGVCFIMGLKMLSKSETARKGNMVSAAGMTTAAIGTLVWIIAKHGGHIEATTIIWIVVGMIAGTVVGIPAAKLVKMTAMPEMVALFNGFGGIASLLVGWSELQRYWVEHAQIAKVTDAATEVMGALAEPITEAAKEAAQMPAASAISIFLAVLIGGVTFTGSVVAFLKLSERMKSAPMLYPGQQVVNALLLVVLLACGTWIAIDPTAIIPLYLAIVLSFVLGVACVIPIGGGDMPVVISLLNSYSGLAACAAGFAVNNVLLIITGALVGASGIILTRIMCIAMNRSLGNVLFSGFGAADTGGGATGDGEKREAKVLTPDKAYFMLEAAQKVIFVPGYGMAVAQAQHAVKELANLMEANGTEVQFVVHPVAGRMPGHMNVLLAEADVPYEALAELDDVNPTMELVDVAIVLGANDVVNPLALEEGNPISGMPIAEVQRAKTVFTMKRSLASGYAGIANPLFYLDNNYMVLGDAKKTLQALIDEFKSDD
ncbi:MAG: NAD(P)(+) transhydrogenase (Re/Si-specific) subunit beta [Phycisphaeraceae bacterium]|nr:MAG: NAD(P)(+) transhydrogenase (Re/Si-specific) subunit beta [Phycisphaeraceae bacterium]